MREIRIKKEVIEHAATDAINMYVREALIPRCPELEAIWHGPDAKDLNRKKYEIARIIADQWKSSQIIDGDGE